MNIKKEKSKRNLNKLSTIHFYLTLSLLVDI